MTALMCSVVLPCYVVLPLPLQAPQIEQGNCCTNEEAHAHKCQCTKGLPLLLTLGSCRCAAILCTAPRPAALLNEPLKPEREFPDMTAEVSTNLQRIYWSTEDEDISMTRYAGAIATLRLQPHRAG